MRVAITATGLLVARGPHPVEGFSPRRDLPNRKHLKLMTRAVRLGVAAVGLALRDREGWEEVSPERRGLFVGSTPGPTDLEDLLPALRESWTDEGFDVGLFGEAGVPLVPPLWLVRGLSNNVLGLASAYHDIRGVNGNRCEGRAGGLAAILDGARAVSEGRADLVVAGGADSLLGAAPILGRPGSEGAAFVVLEPGHGDEPAVVGGSVVSAPGATRPAADPRGELGAATGPVELVRRLRWGERELEVVVEDEMGVRARLVVG